MGPEHTQAELEGVDEPIAPLASRHLRRLLRERVGEFVVQGQYDRALAFMKKADEYESLPPIEEIYEDEWLDGLRSTGEFQEFLTRLEKRQKSRP